MRRKDRETSAEFAWAAFDKCNYAVVSVVDLEGEPYAVPFIVAREENHVYYHNFVHGKMYEVMRTNPRVCITAVNIASVIPMSNDLCFCSAVLKGTAHLVEDPEEVRHAMWLICSKTSPDNLHNFAGAMPFSMPHLGVVRIDVDEITGKANLPGISQDAVAD